MAIDLSGYENRRVKWDKKFEKSIKIYFKNQIKKISELSKNNISYSELKNDINKIIDNDRANLQQRMLNLWLKIVDEFGKWTYRELSNKKQFSIFSFAVMNFIQKKVFDLSVLINDYSKKVIGQIIDNAIVEGLSIFNTVKIIQAVFDNRFSKSRAKTIARTQINAASNYGSLMGAEQSGADVKKFWIRTFDNRVRPTHKKAHGQERELDQKFNVGNSQLMFPGDPSGEAKEVINCRCSLGYK